MLVEDENVMENDFKLLGLETLVCFDCFAAVSLCQDDGSGKRDIETYLSYIHEI